MALHNYEVNRNWDIRAETPLAAALRVAIEEGDAEDRYSYMVTDCTTGDMTKVRLDRSDTLQVIVTRVLRLPGGKMVRIDPEAEVLDGPKDMWLVIPHEPGQPAMMSLQELHASKETAMRRARHIASLIRTSRAPRLR